MKLQIYFRTKLKLWLKWQETQTQIAVTQTQITNNSAVVQEFLQNLRIQQNENHNEIKGLFQSQIEIPTQIADTQTQIALTQTQIANNSATVNKFLQNLQIQQNENHNEIKDLLQCQTQIPTQMADTQTQIAVTQTQIANYSATVNKFLQTYI